jgi:hypothetical protein
VKSLVISITVFLLLCGTVLFFAFMHLTEQTPKGMVNNIVTEGKLFLYKHDLVEKLSAAEMTRLYRSTCTRQCHSKDVIEDNPRTAMEWEEIVTRMKAPDRAGITDRHAAAITHYLQTNFLSNIPTVLPEKTMRFIKRHLWKSDFGESDLYLDIIYIPHKQHHLLPYLVASSEIPKSQGTSFVVFINTHQGQIPPWNIAEMATLNSNGNQPQNAIDWKLVYQDGQLHHAQGILSFPDIDVSKPTVLEVTISLPGLRARTFQWSLPIPLFTEKNDAEH